MSTIKVRGCTRALFKTARIVIAIRAVCFYIEKLLRSVSGDLVMIRISFPAMLRWSFRYARRSPVFGR